MAVNQQQIAVGWVMIDDYHHDHVTNRGHSISGWVM
jgi:hypothetical protein